MEIVTALTFAGIGTTVLNIAYVALGLGLVIFFHELGHFAVAKWCDVHVERFSIGFGPILWRWKKGETEYALSAIPFGGYVKMLGQDDMDPGQMTDDQIAEDPRSYSAKSVPQRMAIISAGVIMNIITGMLFYATAFGMGVQTASPEVGVVRVGQPAWEQNVRPGFTVTRINDRPVESFSDVVRGTALTKGKITLEGYQTDAATGTKTETKVVMEPDHSGRRRSIGLEPTLSLQLVPKNPLDIPPVIAGMSGAKSKPGFQHGDHLEKLTVEGTEVALRDFSHLQYLLAIHRDKEIAFHIRRAASKDGDPGERVATTVAQNPFRTLGLSVEIGPIASLRVNSPGTRAGLKVGDKIARVDGRDVGTDLNPLRLPEIFEEKSRKHEVVKLVVIRTGSTDPVEVEVAFRRGDSVRPSWLEKPYQADAPLSLGSLGVAVHLVPTVLKVDVDGPAAKAGVKPNERIRAMTLALPEGAKSDHVKNGKPLEIRFDEKHKKTGNLIHNWAYAYWQMQGMPTRAVTLSVANEAGEVREVDIEPAASTDWFMPIRGIRPQQKLKTLQAEGVLNALALGWWHTKSNVVDIYLTLRNLFTGGISYKELSGPVGIAKVAYRVADQGFADLLLFLGFLSVNLAVLNFLPIPVLDGGHMVFLIWEGVTRRKPSEKVMVAATYLGLAFVLGLMGLVLYLDIFVNKV